MNNEKKRPLATAGLALATLVASLVLTSDASAVPQHRLRRWLGRPAIDPTIRNTVQFQRPRYSGPRTYGVSYRHRR